MFVPSVFDDRAYHLFDDVFDDSFWPLNRSNGLMRTDVEEKDGKYNMTTELPGFHKEDIHMSLNGGTLKIEASHKEDNSEKDEKGNVVRQERSAVSMQRSFYVGKNVKESDIHASYKDGVLSVEVPDIKAVEKKNDTRYIATE